MKNLNTNLHRMDKLQNQLATGRKYAHISDDPVALVFSQAARNKIARLSHYQRSVGSAQDWLNQAESGIMELQKTLVEAYEAAVDAANDSKTDSDRTNISKTVAQLRDHFVDTLNTTFGDKYVFGGYNTPGDPASGFITDGVKPFVVRNGELFYNGFNSTSLSLSKFDGMDASFFHGMFENPPIQPPLSVMTQPEYDQFMALKNDILSFDVGPGISMPVTMNGIELLFVTTTDDSGNTIVRNSFNVLEDLYQNIETGAPVLDISALIKPLQDGQNHLLTKTAEIGGRIRRLDLLEARYEQDEINYARMKSDAEDVDMAEVIVNQKMAEAVYQAALSAGARIIQPSLMDFLR